MTRTSSTKSERIDVRTNADVKSILERAAMLRNTTLSAYLLETALKKAKEDLLETETLHLRDADRDAFFSALASPPLPNAALKALFKDGRKR